MREWPLRGELRSRKKASAKLRTCLSTLRIHIHKWTRSREREERDRLKRLRCCSSFFLSLLLLPSFSTLDLRVSFFLSFRRNSRYSDNENRPEHDKLPGAWFRFLRPEIFVRYVLSLRYAGCKFVVNSDANIFFVREWYSCSSRDHSSLIIFFSLLVASDRE